MMNLKIILFFGHSFFFSFIVVLHFFKVFGLQGVTQLDSIESTWLEGDWGSHWIKILKLWIRVNSVNRVCITEISFKGNKIRQEKTADQTISKFPYHSCFVNFVGTLFLALTNHKFLIKSRGKWVIRISFQRWKSHDNC